MNGKKGHWNGNSVVCFYIAINLVTLTPYNFYMDNLWSYYRGISTGIVGLDNKLYSIPAMETKRAFLFSNINYEVTRYFGFGMPANDKMLSIVLLYIETMSVLIAVAFVVGFIVLWSITKFNSNVNPVAYHFSKKVEAFLDTIFALLPTVLISYLLIPALGFIFQLEYDENFLETLFNVYIIGHQWYWTYEIDTKLGTGILVNLFDANFNFPVLQFDSYMIQDSEKNRLLNVDKCLVLPNGHNICFYITSHDVIHAWAVPQLGIKIDALPGRLMRFVLYSSIEGVYYGQCSELCGVNHAFMPICVEIVKNKYFIDWIFLSLDVHLVSNLLSSISINDSSSIFIK